MEDIGYIQKKDHAVMNHCSHSQTIILKTEQEKWQFLANGQIFFY